MLHSKVWVSESVPVWATQLSGHLAVIPQITPIYQPAMR